MKSRREPSPTLARASCPTRGLLGDVVPPVVPAHRHRGAVAATAAGRAARSGTPAAGSTAAPAAAGAPRAGRVRVTLAAPAPAAPPSPGGRVTRGGRGFRVAHEGGSRWRRPPPPLSVGGWGGGGAGGEGAQAPGWAARCFRGGGASQPAPAVALPVLPGGSFSRLGPPRDEARAREGVSRFPLLAAGMPGGGGAPGATGRAGLGGSAAGTGAGSASPATARVPARPRQPLAKALPPRGSHRGHSSQATAAEAKAPMPA